MLRCLTLALWKEGLLTVQHQRCESDLRRRPPKACGGRAEKFCLKASGPGWGPDMRVLLIEDDSATAQSIELMLKSESFNVYTTDLGEEGVDLGKLYDYDIILLDLNLPDMSGYEVLRSLRIAKVKTPILILSCSFWHELRSARSRLGSRSPCPIQRSAGPQRSRTDWCD